MYVYLCFTYKKVCFFFTHTQEASSGQYQPLRMQKLEHQLSVVLRFLVPTKTRYKKGPSLFPCQPFPSAGGEDQRWKSSWVNDKNYSHHHSRSGSNDGECCLFKGVNKRWGEVRKSRAPHQLIAAFRCWWTVIRGGLGSYVSRSWWVCALPLTSLPHTLLGGGWDLWTLGTKEIVAEPLWINGWEYFRNSLSPILATHPSACLLQYLNPAHPSSLIKGALLDLLRMLLSVVMKLGIISTSSSIFSCAISMLRKKLLHSSKMSRFCFPFTQGERGRNRREEEAIRRKKCSFLQPYEPLHQQELSGAGQPIPSPLPQARGH